MGPNDKKTSKFGDRFDREGHQVRVIAEARTLERQQKEAVATLERPAGSSFTILCDEGPYLRGDDSNPPPLSYLASSIAF